MTNFIEAAKAQRAQDAADTRKRLEAVGVTIVEQFEGAWMVKAPGMTITFGNPPDIDDATFYAWERYGFAVELHEKAQRLTAWLTANGIAALAEKNLELSEHIQLLVTHEGSVYNVETFVNNETAAAARYEEYWFHQGVYDPEDSEEIDRFLAKRGGAGPRMSWW